MPIKQPLPLASGWIGLCQLNSLCRYHQGLDWLNNKIS